MPRTTEPLQAALLRTLRALALAVFAPAAPLLAASSATVTIDVQINASVSIAIDGGTALNSSTYPVTVTPGGSPVLAPSTVTIRSDASGILEKWRLSSGDAYDQVTLGTGWQLVSSTAGAAAPDVEQFAIQAIFISSNAAAGDCAATIPAAAWNSDYAAPLTAAGQTYTASVFADTTVIGGADGLPDFTNGAGNGRMKPGSKRGLCWRLTPPATVNSNNKQTIAVTITATSP